MAAARHPALLLAAAAVLLLAPSLATGVITTHSSAHNLAWATQFADQFRAGILYPRWMPASFDGLGSPAFYFYPPLAFWIDAALSAISFDALPVPWRLGLGSILILWLSGLAMHSWLGCITGRPRVSLVGAVAYMAAPYHLLDHYMRGALAEFTAYALLPVLMLSVHRLAMRQPFGVPLLAVSYAGLLVAHLPTALLVSATLLPAFVLFRAWSLRSWPAAWRLAGMAGLAGALGAGLAAIYLVPALELQSWISPHQLWKRFYLPENWLLLWPERWPDPAIMQVIGGIAIAVAMMCVGLCVVLLLIADDHPVRAELGFWTVSCLVGLLLIGGLIPWFWDVPLIAKVQFPWRLMVAVEFAAIAALCLAPIAGQRRAVVYIFVAAAIVLVSPLTMIGRDAGNRIAYSLRVTALEQRDVKEYQPRGYPQNDMQGHADLGLEPLKGIPLISCKPAAIVCRADPGPFGELRIEVDSGEPTVVTLRRFFFPAWQLEDGTPLAPMVPLRLVSFGASAGRTKTTLRRVALPEEKWGWAISGLSLALILAVAVLSARNRVR
jgi:hypothetical protein